MTRILPSKPIFIQFYPHNDARIKSSKVSNFNEAHKWLLLAFCFENSLSQIVTLEEMTSIFGSKFHETWSIGITLIDASIKIAMPHIMLGFHIHASNFLQTRATRLYLHCIQLSSIQIM